jgi:hypothetical protein
VEGQLFASLYPVLVKRRPRRRGRVFNDSVVVAVLLWAALHDRPTSWACCRAQPR